MDIQADRRPVHVGNHRKNKSQFTTIISQLCLSLKETLLYQNNHFFERDCLVTRAFLHLSLNKDDKPLVSPKIYKIQGREKREFDTRVAKLLEQECTENFQVAKMVRMGVI